MCLAEKILVFAKKFWGPNKKQLDTQCTFSYQRRIKLLFLMKKMNKILQNVFFKNKKKEERKKCIDELDEMHRRRLLLCFEQQQRDDDETLKLRCSWSRSY